MIKIFKWSVMGLTAGLTLPAVALMLDYFFKFNLKYSLLDILPMDSSLWITLAVPPLMAAAGALYGRGLNRLGDAARELGFVRGQLQDTEQQAEIKKLMEELSMRLDHLVDITNNIHEGICVVDKNFHIEYGYNRPFVEIFGDREYIGKSVFDMVFHDLLDSGKKELKEFLELSFSSSVTSDDMLNDVNPVNRFSFFTREGSGRVREKVLTSKTVRIKNLTGEVENVMFIFNDITLDEKFDIAFEKQEREFQDELSIMSMIFKHDRDLVVSFINELNGVLEKIQDRYQEIEQDAENIQLLRSIQSIVHLVKGEAFSLGFDEIAATAREFEDYLKTTVDKPVTLEVNLAIIGHYENLYNRVDKVNAIARKLFSIAEGTRKVGKDVLMVNVGKYDEIKNALRDIINRYIRTDVQVDELVHLQEKLEHLDFADLGVLSRELRLVSEKSTVQYGRNVTQNFIYDVDGLPEREYRLVKEILVHLIRNSIAHGIEDVAVRRELGKDDTGRINIHLFQEGSDYVLLYSDDGSGFDRNRIIKKAVEKNLVTADSADGLSDREVVGLVFRSGFSTKDDSNMVAGAGVGMSAVKEAVFQSLKGTLKVMNKPGKGVSIKIIFSGGA